MAIDIGLLNTTNVPQSHTQLVNVPEENPIDSLTKGVSGLLKDTFHKGTGDATSDNSLLPNNPQTRVEAGNLTQNQAMTQPATAVSNMSNDVNSTLSGISYVETGGAKNPYTETSVASPNGDRAYGKYQIMGSNIPAWTKATVGKAYTPQEFLNDPNVQEQTAMHQVRSLMDQGYKPNDVASIWFTGRPADKVGNVKDAYGTTKNEYLDKFNKGYNNAVPVNQQIANAHKLPPIAINGGIPLSDEDKSSPAFINASRQYAMGSKAGLTKSPLMTVVDFSKPASEKRLSVINMQTGKTVFSTYAAQGKNPNFSNEPGSHASSLGTFITQQTYDGKHGYSLQVKGIDKGVNDNAQARDIVVHGADYIGKGKTGHSFGCFAVPQEDAPRLINVIKDGTMIYSYGKNGPSQGNTSPQGVLPNPAPYNGVEPPTEIIGIRG